MTPLSFLRGMAGRHLSLRFRSGPHLVEIHDRPARHLPADTCAGLRQDIRTLARKVEPRGDLDYGVFLDDPDIWQSLSLTLVRDGKTGDLIGFNALRWIETHPGEMPLLHLGLAMVDPDRQSQGISWILYGLTVVLLFLRGGLKPLRISNVTQVPAVFGRVAGSFADVYPDGVTPAPGYRHLRQARAIMRDHRHVFGVGNDAWFEEDRFIIRNAYTGGSDAMKKSFEQAAHHRDAAINAYCQAELDYQRGDDFLQIGQMDVPTMRSYFLREVPAGSRRAVLMAAGFAVAQNWVAPLFGWLDSRRLWNGLAPDGSAPRV
ncbi:hypothetical protein [Tropicibacter sp. S64]|uniref:hypothetical protein n=1 Tax=Tropicibacter sp. S64 TaxID=3415122 RepID=UPI003C7D7661